MIEINLTVEKCRLALTGEPVAIAEGSKNYIQLNFDFDTDWQQMNTICANFRHHYGEKIVSIPVENNKCFIPAEMLKTPELHVSLFGTNGDESNPVHMTTTILYVPVLPSEVGEVGEPEPDTPDIFDVILGTVAGANQAASDAQAAAENAENWATSNAEAEALRVQAENGRVTAENGRVQAENKRETDFAQMVDAWQGLSTYVCQTGEYDPETLEPTIANPQGNIVYLVPDDTPETDDSYIEWLYLSGNWEKIGGTSTTITPIDTDTIDAITSNTTKTGSEVLNTTGLSYFFGKLKNVFAEISHVHAIANVTGLQNALNGKANTTHNHEIADVDGLQTALNGKAATNHTHTIANVTGLQGELNAKAEKIAGVILAYAGATAPTGYLLCQGQEVSRTTYAALFAAIGTTYGAGDGSTTFNVPDLIERVPMGAGSMDGHDETPLGTMGGEKMHQLTNEELPEKITFPYGTQSQSGNDSKFSNSAMWTHSPTVNSLSIPITGGGNPHNNMQPYTAVNYIISTGL